MRLFTPLCLMWLFLFYGMNSTFAQSLACTNPTTPTAAELKQGLIAHWSFDGQTDDAAGPNNGTIVGTGFNYADAKYGKGIDLDGGNTYVNVGNDASLNRTGQSITIAGWFRVDGFTDAWQALISKGENNNFRIHRHSFTNNIAYVGGNPDVQTTQNINDGQFHHIVAITKEGSHKSIYIDGVLANSSNIGTTITDTGADLYIGNNSNVPNREWNGVIDDMAIWNRALEPCQATYLYSSGRSINDLLNAPKTDLAIEPIPTLSSWGLLTFGLLILNLSVWFLYRIEDVYS